MTKEGRRYCKAPPPLPQLSLCRRVEKEGGLQLNVKHGNTLAMYGRNLEWGGHRLTKHCTVEKPLRADGDEQKLDWGRNFNLPPAEISHRRVKCIWNRARDV